MKAVAKNKKLAAALWYSRQRCSVIPVGAGEDRKRPLVAWEKYQHERATEDQIRQWWEKWPDANVAIITGPISGIMVVDADTAEAVDAVGKFLSDSMVLPTGETPRDGRHFVFKYRDGLVTRAGVLENIDVRTQGGYVLAPPSSNGKGKYRWLEGLGLHEVDPPEMPDILFDTLQQAAGVASAPPMAHNIKEKIPSSTRGGRGHCGQPDDHARPRVTTGDHNYFEKGTRDETLFHTAHCLLRGGMSNDLALQVIKILAQNCSPPFSEKEAIAKFESALKRKDKTEGNIAELVHDFVVTTSGHFLTTDVHNRLQVTTRPDKKAVVMALLRLKEKGVIEKYGSRDGCYRRVENECEPIDFTSAETETVPLWLPFGLDKMVRTMPGNIIVVAGEPDAGKTALLLNITRYNMDNFKVHYF